ncbi:MAG TPA: iron ABC transporter permease [Candidatus Acidoferrales bacterium]|nr:iron ABC transporter permease [Candidatus Acidoferrales bacterium]
MRTLTLNRLLWICGALLAVLFAVVVLALKVGAVPISMTDLAWNLVRVIVGRDTQLSSEYGLIIFGLRLPRIVLGIFVGAALSVSGAGFQALLRNPLADPYVLGVSSGGSFGAILALIFLPYMPLVTPLAAFVAATATVAMVFFLGRRQGQLDNTTLLLAGVITNSFFSAVIIFLMTTLKGGEDRGMLYWLMGDLSTPLAASVRWMFAVGLIVGIGAIYTTAADLNLITMGEREAMHLGVDVTRVKLVVYVSASLLTGLAVSVSGAIGFVGLLVPHAMRLLFGSDYRVLIPTSAIGGAIAVVVADTLARKVVAPTELPVGAVLAIFGAPFFLYLLRRRLA